jgi:hypothetical protein
VLYSDGQERVNSLKNGVYYFNKLTKCPPVPKGIFFKNIKEVEHV